MDSRDPARGSDGGHPGTANLIPAQPGEMRALKHGAWSLALTSERSGELADYLASIVPADSTADEPAIVLLAQVLARIERANAWLEVHGDLDAKGNPRPVHRVLATWEAQARRLCADLGLTPTSRARLGLDVARARGAALRDHLDEHYSDKDGGDR